MPESSASNYAISIKVGEMELEFLGHQGWRFEASSSRILLDVVGRKMGYGAGALQTYPVRDLPDKLFATCDMMIISHEHADHFEIETLSRVYEINPEIKIALPDISPISLRTLIEEIGFDILEFTAYDVLTVGTISVTILPCLYSRYEPDVYAFLVEESVSGSSFFTAVDAIPTKYALAFLQENCPNRTIDNFTNNFVARHPTQHQYPTVNSKKENLQNAFSLLQEFLNTYNSNTVVISGLGWAYDDSHLNQAVFQVHHSELVEMHSQTTSNAKVSEAIIGYTLHLNGLTVTRSASEIQKEESPNRVYDHVVYEGYVYSSSTAPIDPQNEKLIDGWITGYLAHYLGLGARKLNTAAHRDRMNASENFFLFGYLAGDNCFGYSYDYARCTFVPDTTTQISDLKERYTNGLLVKWQELIGVIEGRNEAHITFEVDSVSWNNDFDISDEPIDVEIGFVLNPRHRSDVFAKFYHNEKNRVYAARLKSGE